MRRRANALVAGLLIFVLSVQNAIAAKEVDRALLDTAGDNPPFDALIDTYIHYGGGNCTKFVDLFAPKSSMMAPLTAGPTGIMDITSPAAVCKWITQGTGRDSKYDPTKNTLSTEGYTLIPLSASLYRMGFTWTFHCSEFGTAKSTKVFTSLWVELTAVGAMLSQWELEGSSLVAIDTPVENPDGQGMCPHY